MATSRTGTANWKGIRRRLIRLRPHVCHWCGIALNANADRGTPDAIEIDHVTAIASGGTDDLENLVLACYTCNRSKGKKDAPDATPRRGVTFVTWRTW